MVEFLFQIDRLSSIAAKYVGSKVTPNYPMLSHPDLIAPPPLDLGFGNNSFGPQQPGGIGGEMYAAGDILRSINGPPTEEIKPMIIELAVAAMEELTRMARAGEPLWVPGLNGATSMLSEEDYIRAFPRGLGPRPAGFQSEASRETAVVIMNHINLVEILMNVVSSMYPHLIQNIRLILILFLK